MSRHEAQRDVIAGRGLAVLLALAGHAGLLLLLAAALGRHPVMAEPPVMRVTLVPSPGSSERPERRSRPRAAASRAAPVAPMEPVALPTPRLDAGPGTGPQDDERIRQALRARLDCSRAVLRDLTAEARARCETRFAGADDRDPDRLNLDPRSAYARDPEPVLSRRPKDGCRVRAAGDRGVLGEHGAAAGVTCAWAF